MDEKTFTQEEVNVIVRDRLAKEKAKYDKQLADVQADVTRREKLLDAKEKLKEKGLPPELAELVRLDDDESFNNSLTLLEKTYKQPSGNDGAAARNRGGGYVPSGGHESSPDRIREAMGLKM